ncbi:hypothetical protein Fot_19275 [Forsythia ovata]|uniref:Uncharacterized protein n=1 Tax=Forsythia ovata TaxID=205694 RepID=A0ABD1VKJ8_9LAMI
MGETMSEAVMNESPIFVGIEIEIQKEEIVVDDDIDMIITERKSQSFPRLGVDNTRLGVNTKQHSIDAMQQGGIDTIPMGRLAPQLMYCVKYAYWRVRLTMSPKFRPCMYHTVFHLSAWVDLGRTGPD